MHNSSRNSATYVMRECASCEKDASILILPRVSSILVSRSFFKLRELHDTGHSSSAANGISSTIEFAVGRIMGNLGQPLGHSTSIWLSGAQDDIAEDVDDDERFYSVVYFTSTR